MTVSGPVALVLGGGGARGALQVGVLRILAEHGFVPDLIVGSSAGSLNGCMVAALPLAQAADHLAELWAGRAARAVFRLSAREVAGNLAGRRSALRDAEPLRRVVAEALETFGLASFADLLIPLHVVVTDVLAGESHAISVGELEPALVASCSIPGVFPPVAHEGRTLIDGGVMENCALRTAISVGAASIVAIDVSADAPVTAVGAWHEVLDRTRALSMRARVLADVAGLADRLPIAVLSPRPSRHVPTLEAADTAALIGATATAFRAALPGLMDAEGHVRTGVHVVDVPLPPSPAKGGPVRWAPAADEGGRLVGRHVRPALLRAELQIPFPRLRRSWIELPDEGDPADGPHDAHEPQSEGADTNTRG